MSRKEYAWHRIASRYELEHDFLREGTIATLTLEGQRYCIGRFQDQYYIVDDRCPHAGGKLSQGKCDARGYVECPLHRFKFDIRTGKNISGEGFSTESFPVEVREDGLWAGLKKKKWWQF